MKTTKHTIINLSEHQGSGKGKIKLKLKKPQKAELVVAVFDQNTAINFIRLGSLSLSYGSEMHIAFLGALNTEEDGLFCKVSINDKSSTLNTSIDPSGLGKLICIDHRTRVEQYITEKEKKYRYTLMLWYRADETLRSALGINTPVLIVDDRFENKITSVNF